MITFWPTIKMSEDDDDDDDGDEDDVDYAEDDHDV